MQPLCGVCTTTCTSHHTIAHMCMHVCANEAHVCTCMHIHVCMHACVMHAHAHAHVCPDARLQRLEALTVPPHQRQTQAILKTSSLLPSLRVLSLLPILESH